MRGQQAAIQALRAVLAVLSLSPLGVNAQGRPQLTAIVQWQDTIILEENADVVNVMYNVSLDPLGGFLVADAGEGQFRRYSREGALLWAFGRTGDGPNEFRRPSATARLSNPDSHVALIDRMGKLAVYDEAGDSLVSTARFHLVTVQDVAHAGGRLIWLAAGTRDPAELDLFHLMDAYTGSEQARMFAPPLSDRLRKEMLYVNWSGIGVGARSDTIWGVTATRDTLYALHAQSRSIARRIPIRADIIDPLIPATAEQWSQTSTRRQWTEGQTFVTDVFPLADGRFVILCQQFRNAVPIWGILIMGRDGSVEFELLDTHRLLAVDPVSQLLVFQDRNALEGNQWLIGKLR